MKSIQLLFFIVICTMFYSCESLIEMFFGKNEEFTFIRADYVGDQLKIDGYYYCRYNVYDTASYYILFLYKNGIVLNGGYPYENELSVREDEFKNGLYKKSVKK